MSVPTAPPPTIVDPTVPLNPHVAGVVSTDAAVISDVDLLGSDGNEARAFLRDGRSSSHIEVLESGFGNTGKTFTVRFRTPIITMLPKPAAKKTTVPPNARGERRGRYGWRQADPDTSNASSR
ncbi:hypothetical protein [Curtobacterium flaccumfaciens]|uniref:hypothetical protein n=1 Tax=Curtobacterium flaccumfaciens TaxID=2035 RepID=UPI001E405010|nr:hypothetical protein [Curtobacterium allii]MCE0459688.1 hypothetical protein [Curtobacterium allii]